MMAATLKWRHEQKIDELLEETFDDSIFGKVGYVSGHDTDGRPVTYVLVPSPTMRSLMASILMLM